MSINDNISILHALQTIESAPHEAFEAYDAEVKVVVDKLKRVLIAQKDKVLLQPNSPESSIGQVFLRRSIRR